MNSTKQDLIKALYDSIDLHEKLIDEGVERISNLLDQIEANKEVNKKYMERIRQAQAQIIELKK